MYSVAETPQPHFSANTRALLVIQDRRHLFVTPSRLHRKFRVRLLTTYQVTIVGFTRTDFLYPIKRSHPHPSITTVMRVMPACPAKSIEDVPLPYSVQHTALGRISALTTHQSDLKLPPTPPSPAKVGRNNYLDPSTLLFSFISGYVGMRGEYLGEERSYR